MGEILSPGSVADLVGGILPHLAQQQRLRVQLLEALAEQGDEVVGQLVGHVQTEAIGAQAHPVGNDAILSCDDVLQKSRVHLIDAGEGVDAPPGGVAVGVLLEIKPTAVGGIGVTDCTVSEDMVAVKVHAVAAGVGEHAVQNHLHTQLVGVGTQGGKVLLGPQHGIGTHVVGSVIAVIGKRHGDGVEIDDVHMHPFEIGQLFPNSPQISAEKVVVQHLSVLVGEIMGGVVPVFVYPVGLQFLGQITGARAKKAIGKDLIHHGSGIGLGRVKLPRVTGQLPEVSLVDAGIRLSATVDLERPLSALAAEVIEIQSAPGEGKLRLINLISVLRVGQLEGYLHPVGGVGGENHIHAADGVVVRYLHRQGTGLVFHHTAKRSLIFF